MDPALSRDAGERLFALIDGSQDQSNLRNFTRPLQKSGSITDRRLALKGLEIFDPVAFFLGGKPEIEKAVVVVNNVVQGRKSAIVVKAAFGVGPESVQWSRAVHRQGPCWLESRRFRFRPQYAMFQPASVKSGRRGLRDRQARFR